ncbi:hypothetical protein E8E14_005098 [Neopestalotiopsis sp. 37M]|nr:hypothetical protein E8E14_005098 [Neopestalotiopsis sp. 37M]
MHARDYRDQQPGLEVVQTDGLEAVQVENQASRFPLPQVSTPSDGLVPLPTDVDTKSAFSSSVYEPNQQPLSNQQVAKDRSRRRRRRLLWIAAPIFLLVIIGAVVGGVVGSRSNRASSGAAVTSLSNDTIGQSGAEMTGSVTSMAPGLAPTAISHGYPHLEVFALTKNKTDSVYRKYRESNATLSTDFLPAGRDMQLIGGGVDFTSTPGVFNKAGYRRYHDSDDVWSGDPDHWDVFEEQSFLSSPAAVVYNPDWETVTTFFLSQGDSGLSLYYYQWHPADSWSEPIQVEGSDLHPWATPAALAWAGDDSRLDVFVVSRANNHLLHSFKESKTDKWSEYEDLGGFVTTPPTAISRTAGTMDVFVSGGDGGLWHLAFSSDSGWSAWQRVSGTVKVQGQSNAISISDTTIDLFAWGADGAMLHKRYDSVTQKWSPEDGFDILKEGGLAGPPKAMTDGSGDINIFAYSDQGELLWVTLGSDAASIRDESSLADVPDII